MSEGSLPRPSPVVTPETEPYWTATAAGRLLLPRCGSCATIIWYPKGLCPACGSTAIEWIEASGQGTVYSFTIVHRGFGDFLAAVPYVLAYVELDEGPHVMTNIVGVEPSSVGIGDAVQAVFEQTSEGHALLRFRPVAGADANPPSASG